MQECYVFHIEILGLLLSAQGVRERLYLYLLFLNKSYAQLTHVSIPPPSTPQFDRHLLPLLDSLLLQLDRPPPSRHVVLTPSKKSASVIGKICVNLRRVDVRVPAERRQWERWLQVLLVRWVLFVLYITWIVLCLLYNIFSNFSPYIIFVFG